MLEIRKATSGDDREISDLVQALAQAVGYTEHAPLIDIKIWLNTLRKMLVSPDWVFLLAVEDNEAVGLLIFFIRPTLTTGMNRAQITEMVVTEGHRGKGVGRQLMEEAKRLALEMSCSGMDVSTELGDAGAVSFYHKMGFTQEHIYLEHRF